MRLLSLRLRNFKGIRDFTLDAQGNNVDVYGDNATGKTTLFDAFTWLLFDKDSTNRKDFEIKTLDSAGQPVHGLQHEVEATIEFDGQLVTLSKAFYEKWTKKRGSAKAEFTGHTTDYFINGVPVKKSEYEARIASICNENVFKLLTNPSYFNEQLHWQDRRKILLEVCGDISDEEVIASDKSLSKLPEILRGRKLDDHRKVIAARRAEINKELEKIPVRIDEVEHSLPRVEDVDFGTLAEDLAKLRAKRKAMEEERVRLLTGGEIAEKMRRLNELRTEILAVEKQAEVAAEEQNRQIREKINQVSDQINTIDLDIRAKRREIADNETLIERTEVRLNELRQEWHRVNGQRLAFNQDEVCPTCGQPIPAAMLEKARDKAQADFNMQKAQKLEAINSEGKALKKQVDALRQHNAELNRQLEALEISKQQLETEKARLQSIPLVQPEYSTYPEYAVKSQEICILEEEIAKLRTGNNEALCRVNDEIARIDLAIQVLEQEAAKVEAHKRGLARIEELKAQERDLAAEYERLEQELYLTEQFVRTKVSLLEDKINSRFKLARFKLFDVQVNGAVVECCETTYEGVPYSNLNHGARINVGLDIINTLAEHYGFAPPIFVDNAEAITQLIPTKGQLIRLIVSEADKKLRVEHHGEVKNLMKEAV